MTNPEGFNDTRENLNDQVFCLDTRYSTTKSLLKSTHDSSESSGSKVSSKSIPTVSPVKSNEGGLRTQGFSKKSFVGKPLISIVTIVYNGDEHLEESINSVLSQSYDNIEYVIVDGGSTDSTLDIIRKYEDKIDYWVSENDSGISDAFNKGVAHTTGDWVGFINADDWYDHNAIKTLASNNLTGVNVVYGDMQYWDSGVNKFSFMSDITRIKTEMSIPHPSVFVSKATYDLFGCFNEKFKIAMDYEFVLRLFSSGARFLYINAFFSNMRLGGVSDKHRISALIEVYKAKKIHIKGRNGKFLYELCFQVIRFFCMRSLEGVGLSQFVSFYRNKKSLLKPHNE